MIATDPRKTSTHLVTQAMLLVLTAFHASSAPSAPLCTLKTFRMGLSAGSADLGSRSRAHEHSRAKLSRNLILNWRKGWLRAWQCSM